MKTYTIAIPDAVRVVTAADIGRMTPYILLEIEDWFEDEIGFIRTVVEPGTQAFDIGANHGIYALAIAARLGPDGHVWAFEPTRKPLAMLRASVVENSFEQAITVIDCALSDHAGTAMMSIALEGEGSSLQSKQGNMTEEVRLDTLDACWLALGAPPVDLVKLDAEGEEERILHAGKQFFTDCSPLVMFEVKSDFSHNVALPSAFLALGYGLYTLVPGLGVLVPFDPAQGFDPFQINLFACKPERAERLAQRGLLATAVDGPLSAPLPTVSAALAERPFAAELLAGWKVVETPATDALSRYLASQEMKRPAFERWRLLRESLAGFEAALRTEDHPALRLNHLRALRAMGRRSSVIHHLRRVLDAGHQAVAADLMEHPFLPPLASWDGRPIKGGLEAWCAAMLADTLTDCLHYSTYFNQDAVKALWDTKGNPNCTISMYRRLILTLMRTGQKMRLSDSSSDMFFHVRDDHLNAEIWKDLLAG